MADIPDPNTEARAQRLAPAARVKAKPKKKRAQVKPAQKVVAAVKETPQLPQLDPLEAAQEAARHAQEGSLKLSNSVDALRTALETIVIAEIDRKTGLPVTALELRQLAVAGLDRYSQICGQNWRKKKLTGPTRAGDKSLEFEEAK